MSSLWIVLAVAVLAIAVSAITFGILILDVLFVLGATYWLTGSKRAPAQVPDTRAFEVPDTRAFDDEARNKLVIEGAQAWEELIRIWIQNFGVQGAPQPPRDEAIMTAFAGYGKACKAYVWERGGLAGACTDTLLRCNMSAPDKAVELGNRVAFNMVQVGTALALPTDQWLERSAYLRRDVDLTKPFSGGPAEETINFSRTDLYGMQG